MKNDKKNLENRKENIENNKWYDTFRFPSFQDENNNEILLVLLPLLINIMKLKDEFDCRTEIIDIQNYLKEVTQ